MGYPNRFRRQADQLGSNGQFDYSAAGGTNGPSAIDAINSSMMQNAAEARVMEEAHERSWRSENAQAVYDGLNKLDPDTDDFLDIYNGLDPRARKLPGVTAKLNELKGVYDKRKGEEKTEWDTLISDARKHGTTAEAKYLGDLRSGGGTLEAAKDNAYGDKGFMTRLQANKDALAEAQAVAADEAAYAKQEAKVNANYDRVTKVLTRTNKRKLDQRDTIQARMDKIVTMQVANKNDVDDKPNPKRDAKLKTELDLWTTKLKKLDEDLEPYTKGMSKAEAEYNKFYNPPELDENGNEIPSRKNKVDGIFND